MGLFLMQLNDTEQEGDGSRIKMNWKMLLLYFRSHKKGEKYAFEYEVYISHCGRRTALKNKPTRKIETNLLQSRYAHCS